MHHPGPTARAGKRQWLAAAALIFAGLSALSTEFAVPAGAAEPYPTRAIMLIVPFPPGGANDLLARLVGERMSRSLGQAIVVENRGGAGGNIGSRQAARSTPDGYTMLLTFSGTIAINPALYASIGYDSNKDLTAIGTIASAPAVLVVNPAVPARTLRELIDYAKANPEALNYGSSGTGTVVHVSTEMVLDAANIKMKHIPYSGTGPAVSDLIGNHVQVMLPPIPSVIGLVKSGQLRALAVTGKNRSPLLPDVPTMSEAGLPGFTSEQLIGLMAPAGTPRPIIERLNSELRAAVTDPAVSSRILEVGAAPLAGTPEEYATQAAADLKLWGTIVRKLGLHVE
ncbi:MAG TPA: tripartite tricarboxylate transporter substrate binding protein [Pseudolabrys sp.]